jgi:uncharacterized protein
MTTNPRGSARREMLTWADVDKLIDMLVPQLRVAGSFDGMILITRGGIIPGGLLAESMQVQTVLTASVDFPATADAGLMAWPQFLQFPDDRLLSGKRLLLVDDVWGSGRTSTAVRERVLSAGGTPFTCVLHFNPYRSLFSKAEPDFYGAITDAYIVYPWEADRDIRGIMMGSPEVN